MPIGGDRFKSSLAFQDACWTALRDNMGYNTERLESKPDVVTVRCSLASNPGCKCKFRVRAKLADDGDWVTEFWPWVHNHGPNPAIVSDPTWRPVIGASSWKMKAPAETAVSSVVTLLPLQFKKAYTCHLRPIQLKPASLASDVALGDKHLVPTSTGEKRRATGSDDEDRKDKRHKRRGCFDPTTVTSDSNFRPPAPVPGPSNAARAYATPVRSPGPSGSVPPLPLPTFTDRPLSISELNQLLISLSTLLSPPAIATALHQYGIDSVARFANLVFAREEWLVEALDELESHIPRLRRVVLMKCLAAKRAEFEGR
ncbi:hypothetical protein RQP46_001298 [Phenoliferia psychrophenolica]